jgi:hypothetical protein
MPSFRRLYGDSPRQLVAVLACFVVAAYAASRVLGDPPALRIAIWFVGAAVVWDLVVAPLLALVDRGLRALPGRVPPVNYLRVPLALSALLLLVFAPVILQRSEEPYRVASGLGQDPYLERWLLVSALLFVGAGIAYAAAVLRTRR